MELNEQELIRRQNLNSLRDYGIDPYPAEEFIVNANSSNIKSTYNENEVKRVRIAGRVISRRIMGKASFVELQDALGRIQLYINRDDICPGENKDFYNVVFKKLLDIGDIIGIVGNVFKTRVGEISVHVDDMKILTKSLRPLPIVKRDESGNIYDHFKNKELRYRMRYVDLTVNPDYREIFIKRSKVINTMRNFFDDHGWLEVETPVLQNVHGGATARPFMTHHNTLDLPLYLRIAPELYLKRLIISGFDGVYEFGKMFRNEGMDRTHNPEFTMMEIYVAYKDYNWMMNMVEECIEKVAIATNNSAIVNYGNHKINLKGPYQKLTMYESIQMYTGIDVSLMSEKQLVEICLSLGIQVDLSMGRGKLIDEIFGSKVEGNLIQPTFIINHPIEMSPLAKKHRDIKNVAERFELFINGKEIGNAYSELNDPIDQKERFNAQLKLANRGDSEAMTMDEDFIRALEFGMPPTSGLGIGIDRLVMLMTNQNSIQEVLFFPQMRPEI